MDWQQVVSLVIVAIAACLLMWGKFRRRKFDFRRDTHCGCVAVSESAPRNSIVFRATKRGRSEVLVKWR